MKHHPASKGMPLQRRVLSNVNEHLTSSPGFEAFYTATEAKNEFGRLLERAMQGDTVVITKHDSPKAVLMSIDKFNVLNEGPRLHLDTLTEEFDALLARMQTAEARAGMKAAFNASPEDLGKAAKAAARKRV